LIGRLVIEGEEYLIETHPASVDYFRDRCFDHLFHRTWNGGTGLDLIGIVDIHEDAIDLVVVGILVVEAKFVFYP
jgi:hypothetical protein